MLTRIVSAAVAIVIAVVVLLLHKTIVFNLAIGFISVVAIYEIFKASGKTKHKYQAILCYAYAAIDAIMPFFHKHGWLTFCKNRLYFGLFAMAMFFIYLRTYKKFTFLDLFFMLGVAVLIPYSFGTLIYMSMLSHGVFLIVITLCAAWLADSGAYFAGTFFGKTKLCPKISPKKTVEGLVGGVLSNGLILLVIGFAYSAWKDVSLNYVMLFVCGLLAALIGVLGDLTASEIKRQCGIKDYGNLMPGHGGVMDRFDSVLLVAPFMYYMILEGLIIK